MEFKKLRNGVLKALKNILYICKFNIQIMLKMWLLAIFLHCFFKVAVFLELCCLVLIIQAWKIHVTSETSAHVHPAPTPTFSILKPLHGARKQSSVSTGSPGALCHQGKRWFLWDDGRWPRELWKKIMLYLTHVRKWIWNEFCFSSTCKYLLHPYVFMFSVKFQALENSNYCINA